MLRRLFNRAGRQQRRFDSFQEEYNEVRPHEALGQRTPAEVYVRSSRKYPERLEAVEYPSHWEVRTVTNAGLFTWKSQHVFISHALAGQQIGLVEVEEGIWRVSFANQELGILNTLECAKRKTGRVLPMSPV